MKVKVICNYHDLQLHRYVEIGEELDVADNRGKELIYRNVAEEIIEPTTPEVVTGGKKRGGKKNGNNL